MDGSDPRNGGEKGTLCVTGATGYIGSWLVRSLLRKGYTVHATTRDLAKADRLLPLWGGGEKLKLFRADLGEEGSFDEAVKGCTGVFHVAASMVFGVPDHVSIESYVQSKILEPAIKGTENVLEACRKGGVKKVIFTSSISTVTAKDNYGKWKSVVDESCVVLEDAIKSTKRKGWVYVLSKLLSEKKAFQFAKESGINIISIIPTTVSGQFLTPTVPTSIRVLLSPITGDPELYPILLSVHSRLGSISVVHVEDLCDAHILLMEHPSAQGRYICSVGSCSMPKLAELLSYEYPFFDAKRFTEDFHESIPSMISSKRLTDLGFKYKYGVGDIIRHSVTSCKE
ncbi:Dihydroflavonol-4-reductase [Acorus calamus]|uniref:Dihydroflavonol-4-reductase n=1 Tax=Acorus calamus TaxID=4465 RepID=A0AAV9E2C1_ACOCL|nr:Dihydroflavonol-4-reductase [Acorus calamus]